MSTKFFAALAAATIALSSAALASPYDPANSPRDLAVERQANKVTSGSAVATRGTYLAAESVFDPANSPRDIELERRANALDAAPVNGFVYRAPVFDPAYSSD